MYVLHGRRTNVRPRRNTRVHAGPLPRTAVAALGSARKRKKCGFSGTGEVPPCAPAAVVWPVRFSRAALCTARGTASAHSRTAHSPLSYEPPLVRNPPTSPPVVSGPARQTLMDSPLCEHRQGQLTPTVERGTGTASLRWHVHMAGHAQTHMAAPVRAPLHTHECDARPLGGSCAVLSAVRGAFVQADSAPRSRCAGATCQLATCPRAASPHMPKGHMGH